MQSFALQMWWQGKGKSIEMQTATKRVQIPKLLPPHMDLIYKYIIIILGYIDFMTWEGMQFVAAFLALKG
jgi:hypothetical protein